MNSLQQFFRKRLIDDRAQLMNMAMQCGGDLAGSAYTRHPGDAGGCFPAGHAAGGYCLVALYLFARHYRLQRPWLWLLPAAFIGPVYGLTQALRGAHFLSHDLVSVALCWFVNYAVFAMADVRRRH